VSGALAPTSPNAVDVAVVHPEDGIKWRHERAHVAKDGSVDPIVRSIFEQALRGRLSLVVRLRGSAEYVDERVGLNDLIDGRL
jgi:hypothetical protein